MACCCCQAGFYQQSLWPQSNTFWNRACRLAIEMKSQHKLCAVIKRWALKKAASCRDRCYYKSDALLRCCLAAPNTRTLGICCAVVIFCKHTMRGVVFYWRTASQLIGIDFVWLSDKWLNLQTTKLYFFHNDCFLDHFVVNEWSKVFCLIGINRPSWYP